MFNRKREKIYPFVMTRGSTWKIFFLILLANLIFLRDQSFAGLKINLVAVNASSDKSKDYPIKYYLPQELKPEDVLDKGDLKLEYDTDKKAYFVSGNITLAPKETKTIKIDVKDVWNVPKEDVDSLKKQIDENLSRVENTAYFENGKALKDDLMQKLEKILTEQENFSGDISRRIESYRSHMDDLKAIKEKIFSVEYWEGKSSQVAAAPTTAATDKAVKLVVEVENPNESSAKSISHKHYLPEEIKPEDIVDTQGFEVRYDAEKKQSYIVKDEEFQAGEKKKYEIQIKDVWNISDEVRKSIDLHAQETLHEIGKTSYGKEYLNNANSLTAAIKSDIDEISKLQDTSKSVEEHIGAYRVNMERLAEAQESIKKLDRILALVREKRLEDLEKSRVRNILQKLQSLKGIEAVSKAVFGQRPTVGNTWKVIWLTIGFIAVFTVIHFATWWQRSQSAKLKEVEKNKTAKA